MCSPIERSFIRSGWLTRRNLPLFFSAHQPNMTILTSLLAATNYKNAFLRTLVPSVGLAFGIQAAVAIPSIIARNEKFYDLSGSVTYLSCTALSLFLPAIRARSAAALMGASKPAWPSLLGALSGQGGALGFNWRQVALSAGVSIWAMRRLSSDCQSCSTRLTYL